MSEFDQLFDFDGQESNVSAELLEEAAIDSNEDAISQQDDESIDESQHKKVPGLAKLANLALVGLTPSPYTKAKDLQESQALFSFSFHNLSSELRKKLEIDLTEIYTADFDSDNQNQRVRKQKLSRVAATYDGLAADEFGYIFASQKFATGKITQRILDELCPQAPEEIKEDSLKATQKPQEKNTSSIVAYPGFFIDRIGNPDITTSIMSLSDVPSISGPLYNTPLNALPLPIAIDKIASVDKIATIISRCYNCGSDQHNVKECALPRNENIIQTNSKLNQSFVSKPNVGNYGGDHTRHTHGHMSSASRGYGPKTDRYDYQDRHENYRYDDRSRHAHEDYDRGNQYNRDDHSSRKYKYDRRDWNDRTDNENYNDMNKRPHYSSTAAPSSHNTPSVQKRIITTSGQVSVDPTTLLAPPSGRDFHPYAPPETHFPLDNYENRTNPFASLPISQTQQTNWPTIPPPIQHIRGSGPNSGDLPPPPPNWHASPKHTHHSHVPQSQYAHRHHDMSRGERDGRDHSQAQGYGYNYHH